MKKLMIIADDLTGSLDTGVQFAGKGLNVKVFTEASGAAIDFSDCDVICVNSESRHIPTEEAYERVFDIAVRGIASGAELIYKKTDSALRGNIGSELSALARASERTVHFVPAYPDMNRTTVNGIQFVNGVLLENSEFANDPLNPLRYSAVSDVISSTLRSGDSSVKSEECEETPVHTESVRIVSDSKETHEVKIYDCCGNSQMEAVYGALKACGATELAGCAGFAAFVADGLAAELPQDAKKAEAPEKRESFIVLSGSVNAATKAQYEYMENAAAEGGLAGGDFASVELTADELIRSDHGRLKAAMGSRIAAIGTFEADFGDMKTDRERTLTPSETVGGYYARFVKEEMAKGTFKRSRLMVVGGDTLMSIVREIGCREIRPLAILEGGTVLSRLYTGDGSTLDILTKSGGFGKPELICELAEMLTRK